MGAVASVSRVAGRVVVDPMPDDPLIFRMTHSPVWPSGPL
jgi:hypothetical protein